MQLNLSIVYNILILESNIHETNNAIGFAYLNIIIINS